MNTKIVYWKKQISLTNMADIYPEKETMMVEGASRKKVFRPAFVTIFKYIYSLSSRPKV